jgi:hypothetical protein
MAGLGKQTRGNGIAKVQRQNFNEGTLPDFNRDGEITKADVLIGRGVIKKPKGRGMFKKGGYVDMSEEHEGMESKAEEAREYAMEDKGYVETKSGKMKKADMLTAKMSKKKKGKMMKGKR